jgi:hypothetical protein
MAHTRKIIGIILICGGMAGYAVSGGSVWFLLASIPTVMLGVALCPPEPGAERISADKFFWMYCCAWTLSGRIWMAPMASEWPWAMFAIFWAAWMVAAYTLAPVAYGFYAGTWPFSAMNESDLGDIDLAVPSHIPAAGGRTMVLSDADMAAFPSFADRR